MYMRRFMRLKVKLDFKDLRTAFQHQHGFIANYLPPRQARSAHGYHRRNRRRRRRKGIFLYYDVQAAGLILECNQLAGRGFHDRLGKLAQRQRGRAINKRADAFLAVGYQAF